MNAFTLKRSAASLLALLLGLCATGSLGAQEVFRACYVPGSGTVYLIQQEGAPEQCGASKGGKEQHVEFEWTDGVDALHAGSAAGGDLAGTYPNPAVVKLRGLAIATAMPTDGQVLRWNHANAQWEPATLSGGGGVTDHGDLTGLADDDHPQYVLADGVRATTTGFAVTWTPEIFDGFIPASGAGTRLMWAARKWGAFRAGTVSGSEWDAGNVGNFSVAFGQNNTASGSLSFAHGSGNTASGEASVAMGTMSIAGGGSSFALGHNAQANGGTAFAMGESVTASGLNSLALGFGTTASGDHSVALGRYASTDAHDGSFVYGDASTAGPQIRAVTPNQFVVRAQHIWLGTHSSAAATAGTFLETSTGAYLSTGGAWTSSSDVNRKRDFAEVDPEDVLSRLVSLPIRSWSYREEAPAVRHIGPTAQDFYAAFGLGQNETSIGMVDADGVSMAAIQALERRTSALSEENEMLRAEIAALKASYLQILSLLTSGESELEPKKP